MGAKNNPSGVQEHFWSRVPPTPGTWSPDPAWEFIPLGKVRSSFPKDQVQITEMSEQP